MFSFLKKRISWQDLQTLFVLALQQLYERDAAMPKSGDLQRVLARGLDSLGCKLSPEQDTLIKFASSIVELAESELEPHLQALANGDQSAVAKILHVLDMGGASFRDAPSGPDEIARRLLGGKL